MSKIMRFRFWFIVLVASLLGIIIPAVTFYYSLDFQCSSDSQYPLEMLFSTDCSIGSPSQLLKNVLLGAGVVSVISLCTSSVAILFLTLRKIFKTLSK